MAKEARLLGRPMPVLPVTAERWSDLEKLFGPRGACDGCWCMWFRETRAEYDRKRGEGNRRAMRALVRSGQIPGLIAYAQGEPAGWVSVGRREDYPVLDRSLILRRVDERPVWSVVCLFVGRAYRGQGVTRLLLKAAEAYVRARGGTILEAYPVDPVVAKIPANAAFHGLASMFLAGGYREVARRSPTRPIVRKRIRRRASLGGVKGT